MVVNGTHERGRPDRYRPRSAQILRPTLLTLATATPGTDWHRRCIVDAYTREGVLAASRDLGGMGRRTRRRAATAATPRSAARRRDHQALVNVSDEVRREFRDVVGNDSIAAYLGRLVERAVERERARRVRAGTVDDLLLLDALERVRELQSELTSIVGWLERRLDPERH